ncbi:MAG: YcaQ family DNA glycosylase, partial [Acidimicrobiia bacterium]|nr:YcaQ family DNA glycosylase [Acidimicrobiia bacterium]
RLGEAPTEAEAYEVLIPRALRHLGIGTVHDIADYHRLKIIPARRVLTRLVETGDVELVRVPGWDDPVYLDPGAVRPRAIDGTTLLTPFDPVCWYRERGERMFDFHYRIEIYTPEKDRVYGYYTLPILVDGDLVGRTDLKADRSGSGLLVRSAWREEGTDGAHVATELAGELERFASWLGLGTVELGEAGNLMSALRNRM